jgi:hypothetical protein
VAEREPSGGTDRLADVRPEPTASSGHAGHDRWLVVRLTTDRSDLTSDETVRARALLASCADCVALASDIEVISRAVATSVTPPRPRDFRLTPHQAESMRDGVLARLRRWLASPGAFVVRPLAGTAVTLGLVLAIASPVLRPAGTPASDANEVAPKATPVAEAPGAERNSGPAPEASGESDAMLLFVGSPNPVEDQSDPRAQDHGTAASPDTASDQTAARGPVAPTGGGMDGTTLTLTLIGILLAGTGLIVLVFTWYARRWQDPLLR